MTQSIWESTVVQVGSDAAEMFEAGIFILFGEPVPPALAEVSLVHRGSAGAYVPIAAGDQLWIGEVCLDLVEVGSRANENFEQLGHIVVYLNVGDQETLPGAVKATGRPPVPAVGDRVSVRRRVGE